MKVFTAIFWILFIGMMYLYSYLAAHLGYTHWTVDPTLFALILIGIVAFISSLRVMVDYI